MPATANLEALGRTLECYYESPRRAFWVERPNGEWHEIDKAHLQIKLRDRGLRTKVGDNELISQVEREIDDIVDNYAIKYVGELAGFKAGHHRVCGNDILVTRGVKLPEPKQGDWSTLRSVLENMLDSAEPKQSVYSHAWLKVAYTSLAARELMPGQALAFVGPAGCGKSLMQRLITVALGGRAAKPFRYMTDQTPFNGDLFAAEHLMIEDEQARLSAQERRQFGSRIKEFAVNVEHSCHPKGRDAVPLTPWWRVTISLNDEGENITALPPMDPSIVDKIIILKCAGRPSDDTSDHEKRKQFFQQLVDELPAYLWWLLNEFEIPAELRDVRYGVKAFQHPSVVDVLHEASSETRLLDLIDLALFGDPNPNNQADWIGKASELQSLLFLNQAVSKQAQQLLYWTNSTGTLLGRLHETHPERVQKAGNFKNTHRWIIKPPVVEGKAPWGT